MDLAQAVLAKLGKKGEKAASRKGGGRFSQAADLAWKAIKDDDKEAFEQAFDAAVRIKISERGKE